MKLLLAILVVLGLSTRGESGRALDCNAPTVSMIKIGGALISSYLNDDDLKSKVSDCTKFFSNEEDSACHFVDQSLPDDLDQCDAIMKDMNIRDFLNKNVIDIALKFSDNMMDMCEALGDCNSEEALNTPEETVQNLKETTKCSKDIANQIANSDIFKAFLDTTKDFDFEAVMEPLKKLGMAMVKKNTGKIMGAIKDSFAAAGISEDMSDKFISCSTQMFTFIKSKIGVEE